MSDSLHSRNSTLFFKYDLNNGLSLKELSMNALISKYTIHDIKGANLPQTLVDEILVRKLC